MLDGRAKDAGRYPPALCRAICRGILREHMQRACGVTSVWPLSSESHVRHIDVEEKHEIYEVEIPALIHRIEAQKEEMRRKASSRDANESSAAALQGLVPLAELLRQGGQARLNRFIEHRNKRGEVSHILALDDMTGMNLEAGKVIDARGQDIQYVRDMRVYEEIPRAQASRSGWDLIKTRWFYLSKGDAENPNCRRRLVGK
ncbi:hypothetical protein N9L68_00265 [bacterium]|nr:hypothetical protein [bacterium]